MVEQRLKPKSPDFASPEFASGRWRVVGSELVAGLVGIWDCHHSTMTPIVTNTTGLIAKIAFTTIMVKVVLQSVFIPNELSHHLRDC